MKIQKVKDYNELSEYASDLMIECFNKPNRQVNFIVASGDTPSKTYNLFCKKFLSRGLDANRLRIILLDEWYGLEFAHQSSCYRYILDTIINPLKIPSENYLYLLSDTKDPILACAEYQKVLDTLTIDLCILGLGLNGHIGFNEPDTEFKLDCHYTQLSTDSLKHPMARGNESRIRGGISIGIKSIMNSQKIVLLAEGQKKSRVVKSFINSKTVSSNFPASVLLLHPNLECVFDDLSLN